MTNNQREFDIIVWGASGFTGRLVAEYLAQQYGLDGDVRWAMAGRNAGKLGEVAEAIGAGGVSLVTGDAADAKSLGEMARRTRAIITTVGPYQNYGEPLVAACAAAGTDYVDLSGEPPFMRRIIDTYQDQAAASGARKECKSALTSDIEEQRSSGRLAIILAKIAPKRSGTSGRTAVKLGIGDSRWLSRRLIIEDSPPYGAAPVNRK